MGEEQAEAPGGDEDLGDHLLSSQRLQVSQANIKYHAAMAEKYDQDQPHFKPENVEKVKEQLLSLGRRFGFDRLLDIGCGTGFVTRIASSYYKDVVGVDLTREMLRVACKPRDMILGDAYHLPLRGERFNVVTAYSVLHHLQNFEAVASEAYRALKWHGCFWSALDPNRDFFHYAWQVRNESHLGPLLEREVHSFTDATKMLAEKYGLDTETMELAELWKMRLLGLNPYRLEELFKEVGFYSVNVRFDWFLGQGVVLHGKGEDAVKAIDGWLREMLPLSAPLYKYLEVTAVKV